jgi:hypothetical protein
MRTKTIYIFLISIPFLIIAACSGSKKTTTSATKTETAKTEAPKAESGPTVSTVPATLPAAPNALALSPSSPYALVGSKPGVIPPTETELNALKFKYPNLKDPTLDKLKAGHVIYTQGACVKCHGTVNIYNFSELDWVRIINDMALRARLSDADKDAVFNYVIAIKTAQPR